MLKDPSHGAEEAFLETFAFVDGSSVEDDLHSANLSAIRHGREGWRGDRKGRRKEARKEY